MDAYRAIVDKRDTREYAATEIPEEVLHRILQAGRMAGSAKNAQPVRFVVIRNAEQRNNIAACGRFTPHVPGAPLVVAVVLVPEDDQPEGEFAYFRGPFDAGRAAQNMMLAAWADGIATCPVTTHDQDCARDVLGLPDGHYLANLIVFGYPAEDATPREGQQRQPLADVVHQERWGSEI